MRWGARKLHPAVTGDAWGCGIFLGVVWAIYAGFALPLLETAYNVKQHGGEWADRAGQAPAPVAKSFIPGTNDWKLWRAKARIIRERRPSEMFSINPGEVSESIHLDGDRANMGNEVDCSGPALIYMEYPDGSMQTIACDDATTPHARPKSIRIFNNGKERIVFRHWLYRDDPELTKKAIEATTVTDTTGVR